MTQQPVFDGHNDRLVRPFLQQGDADAFLTGGDGGHLDLPRAKEGGLAGGIFAVFTPPPEDSKERDPFYGLTVREDGYEVTPRGPVGHSYASAFTNSVIDSLEELEAKAGGALQVVRSYRQLEHNLERGIFSVVLHLEGAAAIAEDLTDLQAYYERGMRSLGLVWSRPNVFGQGAPFRFPDSPDIGPGLTAAGKALVKECNRMGIVIDLAHINEKGFWDVAQLSKAPLVVSHAAVHALCPSTRNLTDRQLEAIGSSNGVVGIIFEPLNIRADGQPVAETPLEEIVRHIDYVVERIGVEHVAFGSDFDGADMPAQLQDVTGLPKLLEALRKRGYDRASLKKIAYGNWFRVLQESWKE